MRFFWSDLHIGHVRLATAWRPSFGGTVETHNMSIRDRWNDTVRPTDEIIIVGDAAMGTLSESLPFIKTFHGTKFLVPGNHDRLGACYLTHYSVKAEKAAQFRAMYEDVFTILPDVFELTNDFIVNHFPWKGTEDHADRELINQFAIDATSTDRTLIHGHTHSTEKIGKRSIHVGVDAWPEGPVSFDTITTLL